MLSEANLDVALNDDLIGARDRGAASELAREELGRHLEVDVCNTAGSRLEHFFEVRTRTKRRHALDDGDALLAAWCALYRDGALVRTTRRRSKV